MTVPFPAPDNVAQPQDGADPPLCGRAAELEIIQVAIAAVAAGTGGALRVIGEAGVGKTRLLREALANVAPGNREMSRTAWGTAEEAERTRPFAALARALDMANPYRPLSSDSSAFAGDATWLAIDRLIEAAEARTGNEPLILVLDDLQWADQGTWLAAAAIARRAPSMGLLLVCMHRPLRPSEPAPVPLSSLGESIQLAPLAAIDALALAASIMSYAPDKTAVAQLGRAAGNPFFTIEIARWINDQQPDNWSAAIPSEVELSPVLRATVLDRVDTMEPAAVSLLRAAALLGRSTDVAELASLTGQPATRVARQVEDAAALGLLRDDSSGVTFRHDLVRAAIRAATPASFAAAQIVASARETVADPWAAQQLALQAQVGDHEAARIVTAAARAPGVAPATVVELLDQVLRIGPDPSEPAGAIEIDLFLALGHVGDLDVTADRGHELLAHSAGFDRSHLSALRRLTARVDVGRGQIDAASATLAELVNESGVTAERAKADLTLIEVITLRNPAAAVNAQTIADEASDPIARCNAELAVAVDAMRSGRSDESIAAARTAVAQAALAPVLTAEIHPQVFLANAYFYAERYSDARAAIEASQAAAERAGIVWPIPHQQAQVAGDALRVGDFELARTAAQVAIDWSLDTGQRIGATWPHVIHAALAVHTGEHDDALASLALAEADLAAGAWQGTEAVPWAAALVAEATGDAAGAVARLAPVAELAGALGWYTDCRCWLAMRHGWPGSLATRRSASGWRRSPLCWPRVRWRKLAPHNCVALGSTSKVSCS